MLLSTIWNCLTGYVIIKVEGLSLERFLNIAASNGVRIWQVKRIKYTLLSACVSERGYRKLLKLLAESRFELTLVNRHGIPALVLNAKRRFALTAGLLLLVSIILVLSLFVWQVEVTGTKLLKQDTILEEVNALGGNTGVLKSSVDLKTLERELIEKHREIAWVNAEFQGIVLKVQIVEADLPSPIVDDEGTADIIASKDAYIKKIIVFDGKAAVKEGQTVRKGQTLIEGEIWEEGKPRMSFHARGKVTGALWYAGKAESSLYETVKKPTGKTADLRYMQIGNNLVLIGGNKIQFAEYEKKINAVYELGEDLFFPVKIMEVRLTEVTEEKLPRSMDIVKAEAEEKAYQVALKSIPAGVKVVGFDTRFDITEDTVQAICNIETEEEIGVTKKTS